MNNVMEDPVHQAIIEQASAWFIRHRSGDLSREDKEAFLEWLRASKLNMHEYFQQVQLHRGLAQTLPALNLDQAQLLQRAQEEFGGSVLPIGLAAAPAALPRRRPKRRFAAALAAAITLAIGATWAVMEITSTQRISAARGEQRTVQLPDGSTIHVNVSSQVTVKYSRHERLVELNQGQVMFEVAHDPTRPFRVRAGDADVVAVGTRFDVYRRQGDEVIVTVVEGKVDVARARSPARPLRMSAGEKVELDSASAKPVIQKADLQVATAWTRREVIFNGESLAEVTAEINRYVAVPIRIEDDSLNRMRVRAVFNAYDSDSFIAFLRQYDVQVRVTPDAIHVRRN